MRNKNGSTSPGPVAFFGSGETAPNGRKVFNRLLEKLPHAPQVSLLETPAGFELNSRDVAGNIAEFIEHHLQNFEPETTLVPARKKGTEYSPQDPEILKPLLTSDMIFMGPGSPSYAIRQLEDSLAWDYILARHRLGAGLALASASTIAVGSYALPVYEIYKVGEDIHWLDGLDLFGTYGLSLIFVPHWNNKEGGENLDTSRCFMGKARFQPMKELLPEGQTIVGIDEHTGLIIDLEREMCDVIGLDRVIIQRDGEEETFQAGDSFSIFELGEYQLPQNMQYISPDAWEKALEMEDKQSQESAEPGPDVIDLLEDRKKARANQDWESADDLREKIENLGWEVRDTPQGQEVVRK